MSKKVNRAEPELDLLAAEALGFLAEDQRRLHRFVDLTGLDPAALRQAAAAPGFGRAILAYLGDDDALIVAFAAHIGRDPAWLGNLLRTCAEREAATLW